MFRMAFDGDPRRVRWISQGRSLELVRDGTLCNRMETSPHAQNGSVKGISWENGQKLQSAAAGRSIGEVKLEENAQT